VGKNVAMTGKTVGYIRVSSVDQNPARQLDTIKLDKTFIDYVSAKNTKRPQLEGLLDFIREGDTLVVHSMDRLARNLDDLRAIVYQCTQKQVTVQFIKESLVFTGENSPMANLLLSVMGAFAEFERALIKERQSEGIALAKKRGVYKGRKRSLSNDQVLLLKKQVSESKTKSQLARELKVSRETLYKYLKAAN
jgi:DNA invertase Pin-like site-specific DNA recombinase